MKTASLFMQCEGHLYIFAAEYEFTHQVFRGLMNFDRNLPPNAKALFRAIKKQELNSPTASNLQFASYLDKKGENKP